MPDQFLSPLCADLLKALWRGPLPARTLCAQLQISQPSLSRVITEANERVYVMGKARATRYFARRTVAGESRFELFRVTAQGQAQMWGALLPVYPGYIVEFTDGRPAIHSEGLPWWLQDMRPQGFLGRNWVRQHAARLDLGADLLQWHDDDVVLALSKSGEHDLIGNVLLGETAYAAWLAHSPREHSIPITERARRYPQLAQQVLAGEVVGSSAAGEQPKFVARVLDGECFQHVLVKFSADIENPTAQRWRDLLLAEHIALQVLAEHNFPASQSSLLDVGQQRFLEVARFDRITDCEPAGRRGLISLAALEAEFVGRAQSNWAVLCATLARRGYITAKAADLAFHYYAFGQLIGNTDMHHGNLAFIHEGDLPLEIAPCYDMLPMSLAPERSGAMRNSLPDLVLSPQIAPSIWRTALSLAQTYWQRVAQDTRCSADFAALAHAQKDWLSNIENQLRRMYSGAHVFKVVE